MPRHEFVPPAAWVTTGEPGRTPYGIGRARDENEWLEAVYPTPASSSRSTTVLRRQADLMKLRWTYKRKAPGRPPIQPTIRALVLRLVGRFGIP